MTIQQAEGAEVSADNFACFCRFRSLSQLFFWSCACLDVCAIHGTDYVDVRLDLQL
jgi:hypothetical protein